VARGPATLELGNSQSYDTPIVGLVAERLAVTVPLALLAMALSTVLALAAGLYAASRHNRAGDLGVMAASQLGIAVPSFWFGILLVMLFAVKLPWFPAGGFPGWTEDDGGGLWDGLQALAAGRRAGRGAGPSSRVSPARRCSTCCARTSCAPRAPRACRAAPCCGACCATPWCR
jgi:hypothetical protein